MDNGVDAFIQRNAGFLCGLQRREPGFCLRPRPCALDGIAINSWQIVNLQPTGPPLSQLVQKTAHSPSSHVGI